MANISGVDIFSAKNGENLRVFLFKSSVGGGDPLVTLGIGRLMGCDTVESICFAELGTFLHVASY